MAAPLTGSGLIPHPGTRLNRNRRPISTAFVDAIEVEGQVIPASDPCK
jgi:hypothetical protein